MEYLILVLFAILVFTYFYFDISETSLKEASLAMAFFIAYNGIYFLVPPFLNVTNAKIGLLFEFIPLVSLVGILLPILNKENSAQVTKMLGWIGLIIVSVILICFKLFVW